MADKGITIDIKTTADTSGAVAVDRAIDEVNRSAKESDEAAKSVDALTEAESKLKNEMGKVGQRFDEAHLAHIRSRKSANDTAEAVAKLTQAEIKATEAAGNLTQAEIKAAEAAGLATKKFNETALAKVRSAKAAQAAGPSMQKFGMLANQASYQLGDFTTQVSMGTSAVRAFSMQAPQMIGAFQMAGVVTGKAAMALGGFAVAIPLVGMAIEKFTSSGTAEKLTDQLNGIGEAAEKETFEKLQKAHQAANDAAEAAARTVQKWDELTAARTESAAADEVRGKTELEVQEKINQALGLTVDLTRQRIELEKAERIGKAGREMQGLADSSAAAVQTSADKSQAVFSNQRKIDALKSEAQEQLRQQSVMAQMMADVQKGYKIDENLLGGLGGVLADWISQAAVEGRAIEELAKQSAKTGGEIRGKIKDITELELKSAGLITDAEEAANKARDTILAKDERIAQIAADLALEERNAQADEITNSTKAQGDRLKEVLSKITPLHEGQKQAYSELEKVAVDGKVTADETLALGANLSKLVGGVQSGMSNFNGNISNLYAAVKQMEKTQQELGIKIMDLQGKLKQRPR